MLNIQKWLQSCLDSGEPRKIFDLDKGDYEDAHMISEPLYGIQAYARFDEDRVYLPNGRKYNE